MNRCRRGALAAALLFCFYGELLRGKDPSLEERYREAAGRIVGAALTDLEGWNKLEHLTTQIGPRLSGSRNLAEAVQWAVARMREEGLSNVRLQPVKVPHWVRGSETASVLSPVQKRIAILGLGGSVGTPGDGIAAPVVVVRNFEELDSLGREGVAGKIVLYAVEWEGYGRTVRYRSSGASRAAKLGAVAALVRSATGRSLYTPHTGALNYDPDAPKIPAAAVTVEDAEWMRRLIESGQEVRVQLAMAAQTLPDADSANVMGEITGRELPQEIVVMGGHLDSWDVGQGAHDDGGGVIAAWQALTLMKKLGLQPRRTLRVVLWTNEENGGRGGRAYLELVGNDIKSHVAAIEMDGGAERPVGFGFSLPGSPGEDDPAVKRAGERLRQIGRLLEGIQAGTITNGGGGADIGPLMRDGVPGISLQTAGDHYFDWHHTHSDTLDKVDRQDFRRCVAALAVLAYILADMPERL